MNARSARSPGCPNAVVCPQTLTRIAGFSAGSRRARVWDVSSGSQLRGPWEDRDLRDAFMIGESVCAIAPDSTFVTCAISGEVLATGGCMTELAAHPRPGRLDERHVAFRTPDGLGLSVWDVLRGVEVARVDAIEGFGPIVRISGCGSGRVAVVDGREAVVLEHVGAVASAARE